MIEKFKALFVIILLSVFLISCSDEKSDTTVQNEDVDNTPADVGDTEYIYIASWNVENLFDTIDDPGKPDEEFTPTGEKKWDDIRLNAKLENLAKVIEFMDSNEGPDILGVQEVEHESLLTELISKELSERNYKVVYEESPDYRGIDNGIIYDDDIFDLVYEKSYEVYISEDYTTRLILHAAFTTSNNDTLHVFVNHWPSRRGGEAESEPKRIKAAETLAAAVNDVYANDTDANIVILGDFNDEPANNSLTQVVNAADFVCESVFGNDKFYNLAYKLYAAGYGTYLYQGNWNMLDQIVVSSSLLDKNGLDYLCDTYEVIKPEFQVQQEGSYAGASLPTFGGATYFGGYSDHYAVGAKFALK